MTGNDQNCCNPEENYFSDLCRCAVVPLRRYAARPTLQTGSFAKIAHRAIS
jgi:hypothetical protein